MTGDTPQDTTTVQDTPATAQQVVQESPKIVEQPKESPSTETPTEEPKILEPVPEIPQTLEQPKEEEQKPVEETKPDEKPIETKIEEKPKEEIKPEPEKPLPAEASAKEGQTNLDELRVKANKERQDRKQEHLSEVEKLAKSKQINNDNVREFLHVSQSTATEYLKELSKQGKIKKSGKAKSTSYSS